MLQRRATPEVARMFDPYSSDQITKLRKAVKESLTAIEPFARRNKETLQRIVGTHYSDETPTDKRPLNLLDISTSIMRRSLASSDPRAAVTALRRDLKQTAHSFNLALNKNLEWMDFGRSMKLWVMQGICAPFGILKVCVDANNYTELEGTPVWGGNAWAEPVLFEDWVHDMSARDYKYGAFCGHRYCLPREDVLESPLFDDEAKEHVRLKKDQQPKSEIDSNTLSRSSGAFKDDYREMVELWDIWLPYEKLVITFGALDMDGPALRIVEWDGPQEGPYFMLSFKPIPGNTMPLPPVANLKDIDNASNKILDRLIDQGLRQKTVGIANSGDEKLASRIMDLPDGGVTNGELTSGSHPVVEMRLGGIDQSNLAFYMQLRQLFSYAAGNMDSYGGLASMTGTVGQDEMLQQSSSQLIQDMQESVQSATRSVMRAIGWYLWHDELAEIPVEYRIPGSEETAMGVWNAERRKGEWYDYAIDIEPHSLQQKSPQQKRQFLTEMLTNFLIPAEPAMAQQGIAVNYESALKLFAKLENMPELMDLVRFMQGETEPGAETERMPKTGVTKRQYEHVSKPGNMTMGGKEAVLMNNLMGAKMSGQMQEGMLR